LTRFSIFSLIFLSLGKNYGKRSQKMVTILAKLSTYRAFVLDTQFLNIISKNIEKLFIITLFKCGKLEFSQNHK